MDNAYSYAPLLLPLAVRALGGQAAGWLLPHRSAGVFGNCLAGIVGGTAMAAGFGAADFDPARLIGLGGAGALVAEAAASLLGGGLLLILLGCLNKDRAA